jgi:S-DNA-T family DNA segregation ATPase FtsK/SpoIIIE
MTNEIVYLKNCLKKLELSNYHIPIVLGKDTVGNIVVKDLVEIPNLLMAGATSTGKSVFLNSVVYTLLKNKTEEELKFVMIDPKQVELPFWDGIPHLIQSPITDMREASATLNWCVQKMEVRFKELEANKRTLDEMPFIVILVDEFADLMLYDENIPKKLYKLAKKGYLVNIHMILSTSSPRESVFTEEIRELIPGRLAGTLPTEKESQIVLGKVGAEELMGNGDMVYFNRDTDEFIRVQAPFVSHKESVELKESFKLNKAGYGVDIKPIDIDLSKELLEKARKLKGERKANLSTSILQRELQVGYNVAKRLLEEI